MVRRSGLLWGIILLLVGLLLLLSNLGLVSLDAWGAVWAVVLIVSGAAILWQVSAGPGPVDGEEVSIPVGGAIAARVHLKHGAGRLRIRGGAGAGMLIEGTFDGGLHYRTQRRGDEVEVEISPRGFPMVLAPWNWGGEGYGWTFGLNTDIPMTLAIETGASEARLDLSEVRVTDLRLQAGASSANVVLPASAGHARVRIAAGAASVSLRVPQEVAAKVRCRGALASVDVDEDRFPRVGGGYQSPGYDVAENKIDIEVEAGVGSFRVR